MKLVKLYKLGDADAYRYGDLLILHSVDTPLTVQEVVAIFGTDKLPIAQYKHTSISHKTRYPTWEEIKEIKELFHGDKTVFQILPPKNHYVNVHPNCFHLWEIL